MSSRVNIVQGHFRENFLNAQGSGDTQLLEDVLLNEIADIINQKPLIVIEQIRACGFNFVGRTRRDLTKAVAQMLQKSEMFRVRMATLIALNTGIVDVGLIEQAGATGSADFLTATAGLGEGKGKVIEWKNDGSSAGYGASAGGMIGAIVGAIGNITGGALTFAAVSKQGKDAKDVAATNLEQTKIAAEGNLDVAREQTKTEFAKALGMKFQSAGSKIPGWLIAVFALAVLGTGAYFLFGRSRGTVATIAAPASPPAPSVTVKESGGGIDPITPVGATTTPASPVVVTATSTI